MSRANTIHTVDAKMFNFQYLNGNKFTKLRPQQFKKVLKLLLFS